MSTIFIIGATGGVGHRLTPILIKAGYKVIGLHRKPEQAEVLREAGVTPVEGDFIDMSADDLAKAMAGADIVVFSAGAAGSGMDRATAIDGEGPAKVMQAMKQQDIRRFYLVSAFPEAGRGKEPKPGFEHYMKMKKQADTDVVASDLDWVILRPGTLLHEESDGQVNAGLAIPYGTVKRGNVAAFLAELIEAPAINREIIELTDGETGIVDAVAGLVRRPA
ncbi:SDR family oxidoreductase [Marinobacterium mangrovicola]|uniref:Putative NAD(P)-binding protein n=1 Tax=Marinobacterium mangrovicola TaxID=1476959 RepID=A0A4R1H8P8_9GAMM|nr:SDR family oxidoreductase [Marinobacterium mangrovicola]TCK16550.1 putative NAD(P)-binding protein [Marinobacterium mangrovicola]